MIDIADIEHVKQCLEVYYARCPQMLPGVPLNMRDDGPQHNDWYCCKLVPSTLTESDVLALEADLPFRLPALFRAYLVTYFVLGMDFGEFSLPDLPSDAPLRAVRHFLLQPNLWQIDYAQFGGGSCGDPVCFDLRAPTPDGDFAIVSINHDMIVPHDAWRQRELVEPNAMRVADSFREFFTRLCLG